MINGNCSLHNPLPFTHQLSTVGDLEYFSTANQFAFGFIPKGSLKLYVGNPVSWEYVKNVIKTNLLIRSSGLPVQSHLNIDNW